MARYVEAGMHSSWGVAGFVPMHIFRRCVAECQGNYNVRTISTVRHYWLSLPKSTLENWVRVARKADFTRPIFDDFNLHGQFIEQTERGILVISPMTQTLNKCLFLDRDGIVNKNIGYAYLPEQIEFLSGIFELCRHFQSQGYIIIIITNQSGIARGYFSEEDFKALNRWLKEQFHREGITIKAIFYCPHHPDITGPCDCRKPAPGMLLDAIKQYRINPQLSIMVGDKASDMKAALAAGVYHRILLNATTQEDFSLATVIADRLDCIRKLDFYS